MRTMLRTVDDHGVRYDALMFVCPGCETTDADGTMHGGLHMLPVNTTKKSPSWTWDGNLDAPTLSPSILTRRGPGADNLPPPFVCHSFLKAGIFEFLGDCTHQYANQHVPIGELYDWVVSD